MSDQLSPLVQFDGNHCVSLVLGVVPRRGLQQRYNNISVFILVGHVFMSSLLIQSLVQHHLSRVSPIQLRDISLH